MTRMIRGKIIVENKETGTPKEVGPPASIEDRGMQSGDAELREAHNPLRDGDTFAPPSAPWVGAEKAWRSGIVPPPHEDWPQYAKRIDKKGGLEDDLTLTDVEVATVLSTLPPPAGANANDKVPASSSHLFKYAAVAALTAVTAWAVISASRAARNTPSAFPDTVTPAAAFESAAMLPEADLPTPEDEETISNAPAPEASDAVESATIEAAAVDTTPRSKVAFSKPSAAKRTSATVKAQKANAVNPYSENNEPQSVLPSDAAESEASEKTPTAQDEAFSLSNPYGSTVDTEPTRRPVVETAEVNPNGDIQTLSRETVRTVMATIAPEVVKCGNGRETGKIVLRITVSGATGRVRDAEAAYAPYVDTPVGFCAARAVRLAKFPPFSDAEVTIKYPFEF